jgi:MoaA/NifB/PqqE/SkfB family radical SAM enzyme
VIPTPEEAEQRLAATLARGSVNLGEVTGIERLMLMLTRSCHLRCSYCFVEKTEQGPVMPATIARRAIDLLMRSARPRLEIQLFGGEPTSEWERLVEVFEYASEHPLRRGRKLELIVTTNGILLDEARLATLERYPVVLLFSIDGAEATHRRFRVVYSGPDATWHESDATSYRRIERAMELMRGRRLNWFMNAVLPPSAASELEARYDWAVAHGVPRLQLNYAVGMRWGERAMSEYLGGLARVLERNHERAELVLFNWRSDCEPVVLSDDLIVDVDGTVLHDGAIFLERSFGRLKQSYRRGHLDELEAFDPLRWSLAKLYDVMRDTYPEGSEERAILLENMRFGAAVDLLIQRVSKKLGREPSRGA